MAPTDAFCGIDPGEMTRMAASLRDAVDRLAAFHRQFDEKLRKYGINASALREIADIAEWGRSQVSMLHSRADLIRELNAGAAPRDGIIRLPDAPDGYAEAAGLARMYSQDIFVNFQGEFRGRLIHEHIGRIEKLAGDPQAAAAFFALLDPGVRDALPGLIARTGSKTAKQDLAAFSKALGAALRAPVHLPAFAKVRNDLLRPPDSKATAWQRLALLAGASAPADVRSAAARALALDDFLKDPRGEFRAAGTTETTTYGLSPDLVALGLEVLAGDGAAVRDAFSKMGGSEVKLDQPATMKRFLEYARSVGTGDAVADAFGRVLLSGTGATTEQLGRHSPAAAAFTLDAILATGSFRDDIPAPIRPALATIATSYLHELVSGTRFDKAAYRSSGMTVPEHWTHLPGITPAFFLSPSDTYRFLKTFVGDKSLTNDFDEVVAALRHDTLKAAAHLDVRAEDEHLERIAKIWGDFASVEGKALIQVRGEQDAADETIANVVKNTVSLGIDQIPVAGRLIRAGWELIKAYAISSLLDKAAESQRTRVDEVLSARSEFVQRQKYDMAHLLYEAGYSTSKPPAELISRTTGSLKTFDELATEAKREAGEGEPWKPVLREKLIPYEKWMDKNDDFDEKSEDASKFQTSNQAKDQIELWE